MRPFVAIGSVTVDRLEGGERLGGSALYAAICARNLGYLPRILTSAPDAVLRKIAEEFGIEALSKPTPTATTFEHAYRGATGERESRCTAVAPPMDPDWMSPWLRESAPTVVCPNVHDVPVEALDRIPSERVLLLPQGWFRRILDSRVVHVNALDSVGRGFRRVSWVVASRQDLSGNFFSGQDWCRSAAIYSVVTDGAHAMMLHHRGEETAMLPVRPVRDADPTGAGDVFSTAAFLAWCEGVPFGAAVMVGSLAASAKIERPGFGGIPTRVSLMEVARDTLEGSDFEQVEGFFKEKR